MGGLTAGGTRVSLVVWGESVDPDDVTRRVGIEPTHARRIGEIVRSSDRRDRKTGSWRLSVSGASAYGAPAVPSDLALELLDRIGPRAEALAELREEGCSTVRFDLELPRLLAFSFALGPAVTERLAALGTLVFILREHGSDGPLRRFDVIEGDGRSADGDVDAWSVELSLTSDALDPSAVTAMLGLEPTRAHRAGEPLDRRGRRVATKGHWCLESVGEPAADVNTLARALLDRLPPRDSWDRLRRASEVSMCFSFRRTGLTGYFELDEAVAMDVALLGANLSLWFGNFGA